MGDHTASSASTRRDGPQILTPLELVDRVAALVPPPRVHRHGYLGVIARNAPLHAAVCPCKRRAARSLGEMFR